MVIDHTGAGHGAWARAPVVLPFELRGELILLNAEVNGQSARLILDTGSGISVLDTAFARQAGVELSNQQVRAQGSRTVTTRVGTARTVRLGAVTMANLRIAVVDLSAVREHLGYEVRGTIRLRVVQTIRGRGRL